MTRKNIGEKTAYGHLLRRLQQNLAQLEAVRDSDYFGYISPKNADRLKQILKEY